MYTVEERGGPTRLWYVVTGVSVFLFLVFWLPWIAFANSDRQQANIAWITRRFTQVKNVEIIQTLLRAVNIAPESIDLIQIIDYDGWRDLRLAMATRHGMGGGWLLASRFASSLRLLGAAQALLIVATGAWCATEAMAKRYRATTAKLMLLFITLVTLMHIFALPKLETLGRDDSFTLSLLMAAVLVRPGPGFWLTLLGNTVLVGSIVAYLGLQNPLWNEGGDNEIYPGSDNL